jgi:hypothetical protein
MIRWKNEKTYVDVHFILLMGIHDGWLKKVEVEVVKLEGELKRER